MTAEYLTATEADRVSSFLGLLDQATRSTGVQLACGNPYGEIGEDDKPGEARTVGELGWQSEGCKVTAYVLRAVPA